MLENGLLLTPRNLGQASSPQNQILLVLNNWLESLTPLTLKSYKSTVFDLISYFNGEFETILSLRPTDLTGYLNQLKMADDTPLSNGSKNQRLGCIKSMYRQLVLNGLVTNNPAQPLKAQKNNPIHHQAIDNKKISKALKGLNNESDIEKRDYAILILLLNHGLRRAEITNLKIENLKGQSLLVHGKGGRNDEVHIGKDTLTTIEQWLVVRSKLKVDSPYLFVNFKGGRKISPEFVWKLVKRTFGCSPHQLRATAVTSVWESSKSLGVCQRFARHQNPATTESIYIQNNRSKDLIQYQPKWK
jgi:integrase/recombinase XerD